jgi:hypothetical protein
MNIDKTLPRVEARDRNKGEAVVTMEFALRGTRPTDTEDAAREFVAWLEDQTSGGFSATDGRVVSVSWRPSR